MFESDGTYVSSLTVASPVAVDLADNRLAITNTGSDTVILTDY